MKTQELQHALNTMLLDLREQFVALDEVISRLESRWQDEDAGRPGDPQAPHGGSGGRRSAGWNDDARAKVAERMRDYWRSWREAQRAQKAAPKAPRKPVKTEPGRSRAGWTPEAREQAASRMRARWAKRRAEQQDNAP